MRQKHFSISFHSARNISHTHTQPNPPPPPRQHTRTPHILFSPQLVTEQGEGQRDIWPLTPALTQCRIPWWSRANTWENPDTIVLLLPPSHPVSPFPHYSHPPTTHPPTDTPTCSDHSPVAVSVHFLSSSLGPYWSTPRDLIENTHADYIINYSNSYYWYCHAEPKADRASGYNMLQINNSFLQYPQNSLLCPLKAARAALEPNF